MALVETLVLFVILGYLFYKYITAQYNDLKERGVPHKKPVFPIGNMDMKVLFGKASMVRSFIDQYALYKNDKVFGSYNMREPVIFIKDIELIKKIGIKDFDNFSNHKNALPDTEATFNKSLIALKDKQWKEMRNTLSPTFTGSKMRIIFELINECTKESVKYIQAEIANSEQKEAEFEMKEYFTRFANDVIASAAFGIKLNSFENKTNEFFTIGQTVTKFTGWGLIKFIFISMFPKVANALRISGFDDKKINFFKKLVYDAMMHRKQHNIIRADMIQLLMEAQQHFEQTKSNENAAQHATFTDEDLLAQCLLFFFAGFETVSTALSFASYELAVNSDVQQKLYEEIIATEEQSAGKPLSYDNLMKMKYLDMILSESLRKWPPAFATDRVCNADYELIDEDGNIVVKLKKDEQIMVPILALHHDPDLFADPEKFDPERFSDERKDEIKPNSYLPFGIGPRNCIGNRFALMETKAILYQLVLNFKLVPAEKTAKNMIDEIRGLQMQPKDKFWLKFLPRDDTLNS